jgi:hyperosmotically inducible protein
MTLGMSPANLATERMKKIMKLRTNNLCLLLGLGLLTIASMVVFTGCAGDRYDRSTGEYIDDKSINMRVRDALNDSPEYKFEGVVITSFKGKVQLSGFVDTSAQKENAGSITRKVEGVKDVDNNITVKDGSGRSSGEYVDDKELASHVRRALGDNGEYKFDEVNVAAFRGTVQLSGFVNTGEQKSKAADIASQVSGVKNVVNNITVKE